METKNIKIDFDKCIGCGACAAIAPNTFILNDENKAILSENITDDVDTIIAAIQSCPIEAISAE